MLVNDWTTTEADRMPHKPILAIDPFEKWGFDFLGPLNPLSIEGYKYSLVAQPTIPQNR